MEESLKYFQPEILDIRVGYECELKKFNKWVASTIKVDDNIDGIIYSCQVDISSAIRVPYLTKEQIEAEGWEVLGEYPGGSGLYKRNPYELVTSTDYRMKITKVWKSFEGMPDQKTHRKDVYNGECKDINTFRQVCKLLGI